MSHRVSLEFPILLAAAVVLLAACGGEKKPEQRTVSAPTVRAALFEAQECRSLPGEVRSQNSVTLSSKVAGTVTQVLAAEGQIVEKGQVIMRIDDAELKQRVEAAQSNTRQAGLERQALAAQANMARVNLERMRKLFAQEAISRDELDRASTQYEALRKQERAMAASEASAGHQGAEARSLLGYSVVVAPFRGVLSRRYVDQGAFVNAGTPLAAIDDVQGGYELEAQADESLMRQVSPGMEVLGLVPAVSSAPFLTRLTTVVGRVDPATRTFKVRAAYEPAGAPNAANATASGARRPDPGMFGKVCLPMQRARKLLIPATAVRRRGELSTVLAVDDKSVLRLRLIKTGGAYLKAEIGGRSFIVQAQDEVLTAKTQPAGLMIEVLSGLTPGETIVNGGPDTLREGDRVTPTPAPAAAPVSTAPTTPPAPAGK